MACEADALRLFGCVRPCVQMRKQKMQMELNWVKMLAQKKNTLRRRLRAFRLALNTALLVRDYASK